MHGFWTFLLGVTASLVAGWIFWLITHTPEVRYALTGRRRYSHLSGDWHQYHLSRDTMVAATPIWLAHRDTIYVSNFGKVTGTSHTTHEAPLSYSLGGNIRGPIMRLRMTNRDAHESPAEIVYPNLLNKTLLIGILVGEDFDRQWFASTVILSRTELSEETRRSLARRVALLEPDP